MEKPAATQGKTSPKDVFLHLFSVILLYFCAINIGILLYQIINISFFDPLVEYRPDPSLYREPLRLALATIVIAFPVYVWSVWYLEREYARFAEKRNMKTRRWLLTFTLFVAALVIIGDAIAVLYQFLQGELTARFLLKVATILGIAGSVFTYYYWALKSPEKMKVAFIRWFSRSILGVVFIIVIGGFFMAGTPAAERLRRFDQRRINDLQGIQSQVIFYWQQKEKLPATLADLTDTISGYKAPVDPSSRQQYEYKVTGPAAFELCAKFASEGKLQGGYYGESPRAVMLEKGIPAPETWDHAAGRVCFSRTIDPELYKKTPSTP